MRTYRTRQSGFTLVEILIVVIILGILAAIVIPQFTNASEDARNNSTTSQLQTLRSQVELFKLQHRDQFPSDGATAGVGNFAWAMMLVKTNDDGTTTGTPNLGPYIPTVPTNPRNSLSAVSTLAADPAAGDAAAGKGFVFSTATGKLYVTDKDEKVTAD